MPHEPYRFRYKRYYTPEAETSLTPDASDSGVSQRQRPRTKYRRAVRSTPKPVLWSLAALGGVAAVFSMVWASRRDKNPQARTV